MTHTLSYDDESNRFCCLCRENGLENIGRFVMDLEEYERVFPLCPLHFLMQLLQMYMDPIPDIDPETRTLLYNVLTDDLEQQFKSLETGDSEFK